MSTNNPFCHVLIVSVSYSTSVVQSTRHTTTVPTFSNIHTQQGLEFCSQLSSQLSENLKLVIQLSNGFRVVNKGHPPKISVCLPFSVSDFVRMWLTPPNTGCINRIQHCTV